MDTANSLFELVNNLWGLASRPLGYICNLKDNVQSLRNETDKLKAKSKDVLARVELEEGGGGVQRTEEVVRWLDSAQKFLDRVDQLLREAEERDRIKCLSRCLPPNCWSSYKLGKRVYQMLNEARGNQPKEGEFGVVTSPLPPPRVLGMPMDKTVGLDISNLNEVWNWLVDEKQVGVIGLYGTGGVGKTNLMKRINEKLSRANHGFEFVIWVVVSRQVNEDSIRDTIRKRLHISDERWDRWPQDEKVHRLWEVLTRKKFMLLIDDVWARLDLSNIGVPPPDLENGSKVVFTTRSKQVCDQMGADKTFEVQCLNPEKALELFMNNVGKSIVHSHPEIPELAKDVAGECKGLPLALITVGRAMAGRKNPPEWKHALTTLRNNPHKLSGTMEEMYHILEFSYDSLNDSTIQRCFLYCCLFPEDYPIKSYDLIEHWIGEGFLGDNNDVYSLRDKGEYVLGSLKLACLLERGPDDDDRGRQYVKMHDVIRDMATWIARDSGQRENKLLVIEKEEDMSAEMISKWGEAEKVSLWGTRIGSIKQTPPECSWLETLFVRETNVKLLPRGFFDSMTAHLTFLNLSGNSYMELFPKEICDLISLRYLNLSNTCIGELPREINKLTRLRWLLLDNTVVPFLIPTGAIESLPLIVFSQWSMSIRDSGLVNEEEMVEELGRMQYLTDLSIEVFKSCSAVKIFQSPSLQRSIRIAGITNCSDLTRIPISYSPSGRDDISHLEELYLLNCPMLREIEITQGVGRVPNCSCFPNLIVVTVGNCGLPHLSWLMHAPKVRELRVYKCNSMEKIIGDGFASEELAASGLFSRLESLHIECLPNLTSICNQTLPFPQLGSLEIIKCPRLRKLPVDSNSARGSLESVCAGADWWAKLEWEDDAARANFTAKLGQ